MDNIQDWGADGLDEDSIIREWLVTGEDRQMTTTKMMEPRVEVSLPRLRQLMLNSAGELQNSKETVPEGWKMLESVGNVSGKVKVKQTKMTNFMNARTHEKDKKMMSTMERMKYVAAETKKWESSKLVTSILRELAGDVPGISSASSVVMEVVDMAWIRLEKIWWTSLVEDTWQIISNNQDLQRVIQWRMNNQRQEEKLLLNSIKRLERIQRSKEASERWLDNWKYKQKEKVMEMEICEDWCIVEYQEHKALEAMMTNLDIWEVMEVESGESGCDMDSGYL